MMMETEKLLKIGLDFHGVINTNPSYFKDFTEYAERHGHQIYIITGGPAKAIESFLKAWGIKYTGLFTILDHYAALGKVTFYPDGNFKMDDKLWNTAKAKFCRKHHIDIHVDDSTVYGLSFSTPYCLYDEASRACSLNKKLVISFAIPPQDSLMQMAKALAELKS